MNLKNIIDNLNKRIRIRILNKNALILKTKHIIQSLVLQYYITIFVVRYKNVVVILIYLKTITNPCWKDLRDWRWYCKRVFARKRQEDQCSAVVRSHLTTAWFPEGLEPLSSVSALQLHHTFVAKRMCCTGLTFSRPEGYKWFWTIKLHFLVWEYTGCP